MQFIYNDGGRAVAGYKGSTGDCVCRAIAIVTGRPYQEIYDRLAAGEGTRRRTAREMRKGKSPQRSAANGIIVQRKWFKEYMAELGFRWVLTMQIGSGCKVHLRSGELPNGQLIAMLSRHCTAVIDGVIFDIYDPSRDGTRCVYGYYVLA